MAIIPRKPEISRVVEILESEHDSAEALAKVLIKTIYSMAQDREWVALANRPDPKLPRVMLFGPFDSIKQAEKAGKAGTLTGTAEAFRLLSVSDVLTPMITERYEKSCATCGHPNLTHDWPGTASRKCIVKRCRCKGLPT